MLRTLLIRAWALSAALSLILAACGPSQPADTIDIADAMPPLAFSLTRAIDNAPVSAADYRGTTVLLYFGYTHCPDECPTTLANLASALKRLGSRAAKVRVLFVTVDPGRDTIPILRSYVKSFAPEIDGLRGDENAIAALARRYRVVYSVTPASPGYPYSVRHSDSVFIFDRHGKPRLVTTSTADSAAMAERIESLSL